MECQPVCLGGFPSGTLGQENVPFQRERERKTGREERRSQEKRKEGREGRMRKERKREKKGYQMVSASLLLFLSAKVVWQILRDGRAVP